MQATTRFHDSVPNPVLQKAELVFHNSVALHSTYGMFYPDADGRDTTIGRFLRWGQFPPTRLFLGLEHRHPAQEESLETHILIETTAKWQRRVRQIRDALIMHPTFKCHR